MNKDSEEPESRKKLSEEEYLERSKNGFLSESKYLCVSGRYSVRSKKEEVLGQITYKSSNIILTLCRYTVQEGKAFAIPVWSEEASGWNVPVKVMFGIARKNTPLLFPLTTYDLYSDTYVDIDWNRDGSYDFDPHECSVAAEDSLTYEKGKKYGMRYIVKFSPVLGLAPLFYPNLIKRLAVTTKKDPIILICDPDKFLIFDGNDAQSNVKSYLKSRYGNIRDPKPEILIYRYLKKNRTIQDLSPSAYLISRENKEAKIPAGSVFSAWGDIPMRSDMLDWKNRKNRSDTSKKDVPP